MTQAAEAVVDTSVLLAAESGRGLNTARMPRRYAISVVTFAELHAGVLAAPDVATRAVRHETLDAVADVAILPIDETVGVRWAELRALLAEAGRRTGVNDLWIAATALAYGIPVVTQDADFDAVEGLGGLRVVRV